MIDRDALGVIDATLKSKGFVEVGPGPADYEGTVSVHGKPIGIRLEIVDTAFTVMPTVTLLNRSELAYEVLAHIATGSTVCYSSAVGLPVDIYRPGQAILRVLEDVSSTLELSAKGRGTQEIADEFQSYWRGELEVRAFVGPATSSTFENLTTFFAFKSGEVQFIGLGHTTDLPGYEASLPRQARLLHLNDNLKPHAKFIVPSTLAELKAWYEIQPAHSIITWEKCLAILCRRKRFFIAATNCFIGFEIDFPKDILEGVRTKKIREQALPRILTGRSQTKIERYGCIWSGAGSATLRNLAGSKSLRDLKVAIIGAGTIGSHLAKFLVQSGAGVNHELKIFDSQTLAIGNIGRHLLGFSDVGRPKALAVATELRRFHPNIKVKGYPLDALNEWDDLIGMDIVLDATGDWNVQNAINHRFMHDIDRPKYLVHSWIVMNGAAAQAFINANDEYSCFRCLKPDFDKPWRFNAISPDHPLNIHPASCDEGAYIPFSVDASAIAAALANKAALDIANGNLSPRLRTVQIDFDRSQVVKPVSPQPSEHCPACKSLRSERV